jgi:UTP--glucose-1-phosphate uridylyltransferase
MEFYKKIESSTIIWVNQHTPKGFGHAVLQARSFTNQEPFIVHAGDTYITSNNEAHINQIVQTRENTDITLCLLEVKNTKHYGIAEIDGVKPPYQVKRVVEKPENPITNLAIMPIYLFTDKIYEALEETQPGKGDEIQLTDGIQKLIEQNRKVMAIKLKKALHLDIGTPESYFTAQKISFEKLANNRDSS